MRKSVMALVAAIVVFFNSSMVFANNNPCVTATKDDTLEITNMESMEFKGMAPGDSRKEKILISNESDSVKDFYILQETVKALEETNKAAGGAYEYDLKIGNSYENAVSLLEIQVGGYDSKGVASKEGLSEIDELSDNNINSDGYTYLVQLNPGEKTNLYMELKLVGEGNDNKASSANTVSNSGNGLGYTNASGQINLSFKCSTPSHSGKDKTIIEEVKTSDEFPMLLYIAIFIAGVILAGFAICKKKNIKIFSFLIAATCMLALVNTESVNAADTITLTFRSGKMGSFDTSVATSMVGSNVKVTDDYIRITMDNKENITIADALKEGFGRTDINNVFNQFTRHEDSKLLDCGDWGIDLSHKLSHNEEYVVDYGVLVDPVMYTIRFVDASSYDEDSKKYSKEIAAPIISYGNVGDKISVSPIKIHNYSSNSEKTILTLSSKKSNEYVVLYDYTGKESEDEVNTNTVYRILSNDENGENGVENNNGNGAGAILDEDGNAAGNNGNNEDGNADRNIEDEDTPLNDGLEDSDDNSETETETENSGNKHIGNPEVPKISSIPDPTAYYLIGVALVVIILLGVSLFLSGRNKSKK